MAEIVAPDAEERKRAAAAQALEEVEPGMRLGLGTGSTARHFVILLGERVRDGLEVVGVPTSEQTHRLAVEHGVPLTTLDDMPELDLTVDGADEIDPALRLIKGGGAALLREKIVAAASRRVVIIADDSKLVNRLGRFPLPIEVAPFGLTATRHAVERAIVASGATGTVRLRLDAAGEPLRTDGGHHILDASLGEIADPEALAVRLGAIPGVMEHGLFIGLADRAIVAGADAVRVIDRV